MRDQTGYAYISYALLMTAYTAVNVPYSALGGVMTGDSEERGNLQTWRFAMAMVGGFLVTSAIFPLAKLLGGGDSPEHYRLGFPFAMTVMAIIAVACFLLCFRFTREHVPPDPTQLARNAVGDLKAMLTNSQWIIIAVATLIIMTRGAMQGASKPYFVNYYLITEHLPAWLAWFMGSPSSRLSAFLSLTMLAGVAGAVCANMLSRWWCKVTVMKVALAGTVVMNVLLFLIPRDAVLAALLILMFSNFCHMMFVPMLFSTVPDTVDFGLRSVGKGAMGMFCGGHLFVLKLGNAFGGFFVGHLLAWFGYQPNVAQTERALTGIMIAFAGSSVVAALLVLVCLQFYQLRRGWQTRMLWEPRHDAQDHQSILPDSIPTRRSFAWGRLLHRDVDLRMVPGGADSPFAGLATGVCCKAARPAELLDMRGNPDSGGIWAPCLTMPRAFWLVYTDVKRHEGSFRTCTTTSPPAPPWKGSGPLRPISTAAALTPPCSTTMTAASGCSTWSGITGLTSIPSTGSCCRNMTRSRGA